MWIPGVSTDWLKVITVLRFHSSAWALGENVVAASAAQSTGAAVRKVIAIPSSDSEFCERRPHPGGSTPAPIGGLRPESAASRVIAPILIANSAVGNIFGP